LGLVTFAQFVLNGLELLAQEVLALVLVHLGLDLILDLGTQLQDLQLAVHEPGQSPQPLGDLRFFKQFLLLFGLKAHGGGDEVPKRRRVFDVGRGHLQLVGQIRHQLDDSCVHRHQVAL
jgi:hypothetical protein